MFFLYVIQYGIVHRNPFNPIHILYNMFQKRIVMIGADRKNDCFVAYADIKRFTDIHVNTLIRLTNILKCEVTKA